jgi:predicted CXXCH cytochrome family protein
MPRVLRVHTLLLAICAAGFLGSVTLAAQSPSDDCVVCHSDPIERTFPNGTTRTLRLQTGVVEKSVHAGLTCVDCHPGTTDVPHPELTVGSSRQLTVALSEQCRQCHFEEHQATLESVHARAVARGDVTAPVCVDCHGSHDVQRAAEPRTRIADTCGRCHAGAAATFAGSVHGEDVARNVADVPTCTDCHDAHRVAGPGQPGWRSSTPEICGNCHGDPARMDKYGLSTNVLKTYLSDFHGKTAALRAAAGGQEQTVVAVCSDCHGTHGVVRVDSPSSPVLKANLANTCRQCHTDAGLGFPDAWMSHYEPSWSRAPVVMGVKTFYAVLIPFMIGGMLLQILLHLWRMAVNR